MLFRCERLKFVSFTILRSSSSSPLKRRYTMKKMVGMSASFLPKGF